MISQLLYSILEKRRLRKLGTKVNLRILPKDLKIGEGCIVGRKAHLAEKIIIGRFTYINSNYMDTFIESNTKIGNYCSIAPGVLIGMGNHNTSLCTTHPILFDDYYKKKLQWNEVVLKYKGLKDEALSTVIGSDVWIGARANLKRGVTVGNGAIIAADCVVTKNVPDYAIVAGVPAKVIGYRFDKDDVEYLMSNEEFCFWNWTDETLRNNFECLYEINEYKMAIEKLRKTNEVLR